MMTFDELLWKEPWLAPVILNLKKPIATKEVKTAGVTYDGRTLYYNPNFWNRLTPQEKLGVQIHEILHIANLHSLRRGERDIRMWNYACDMAINYLIERSGYTLPRGALEGVNESAEKIYNDLELRKAIQDAKDDENNSQRKPKSVQRPLSDDLLEGEIDTNTEDLVKTLEAIETSGMLAGKGSSKLSKHFEPIKSKNDWRVILQSLVKSISGDEVDYLSYEFDEFGICEDILTPKPTVKICALIDESASISDELYSMFLGELKKMSRWAKVYCSGFSDDTPLEVIPLSDYKRTMTGGTCVLRAYSDAIKSDFDNIIILTDGYLEFPEKEPKSTIWVMPESHNRKQEVIIR